VSRCVDDAYVIGIEGRGRRMYCSGYIDPGINNDGRFGLAARHYHPNRLVDERRLSTEPHLNLRHLDEVVLLHDAPPAGDTQEA
jgi:hypothetical protein